MASHARFRIATGCPVFFCDPHSPWQRGSNENTNRLLHDYFPGPAPTSGSGPKTPSTTSPPNSTNAPE